MISFVFSWRTQSEDLFTEFMNLGLPVPIVLNNFNFKRVLKVAFNALVLEECFANTN